MRLAIVGRIAPSKGSKNYESLLARERHMPICERAKRGLVILQLARVTT